MCQSYSTMSPLFIISINAVLLQRLKMFFFFNLRALFEIRETNTDFILNMRTINLIN